MRLSKKPVIARRPNGPTWQSVPKTHEYQHIPDFLVTDSHVAALLGMTEKGLSTRCVQLFAYFPLFVKNVFLVLSKGGIIIVL